MAPRGDCVILLYHRVRNPEGDVYHLDMPPSLFEAHLRFFKDRCNALSFQDLMSCLKSGGFPENAVAVTFDDGYRDCFLNAGPLLEKHGIPAIFFVVSDYIGKRKEYWWDELARIILSPGKLPPLEHLHIPGGQTPQVFASLDQEGGSGPLRPSVPGRVRRLALIKGLEALFRRLDEPGRDSLRRQLLQWTGRAASPRESHLAMDETQVRKLASHGLFTVGSHTKTHPLLLNLSPSLQREEILGSIAALDRVTGGKTLALAYPHGTYPVDYDGTSVEIARDAGLHAAFGVLSQKPVSHETRFELPRFSVPPVKPRRLEDMIRFWRRHHL
jgi:peptidoglycan/xylan/chitin deacetylase (PgdA/CDA1 family)